MKQSKKRNMLSARLLSGLLSLLLLLSLCPAVFAAEGTISIGTLEELTAFAKRCASDDYSNGLTVVLTADIDVDGDAVSIPIFLGSFDGQGHKITGLQLTESNSSYGLFSRVEAGATVKNLTVEGEIAPSGTQSAIGGIVGENYGSVEKREITTGPTLWGQTKIYSGMEMGEYVAFPYGVKEGAPTEVKNLSDLYQNY